MSIEENVQTVKDFVAAIGRGDKQGLPGSVRRNTLIVRPLPTETSVRSGDPAAGRDSLRSESPRLNGGRLVARRGSAEDSELSSLKRPTEQHEPERAAA